MGWSFLVKLRRQTDRQIDTLRRSIIVPGGANNEYRGGFCGSGIGFRGSGGGFLVLVAVVACHYVYYH